MKKLQKLLPYLIGITAIVNEQFDVLIGLGVEPKLIGIIKLSGLILALFSPKIDLNFLKKEGGDGAITPNKAP